uniref:F-box domain-containing protein n=1 Tax=Leersia perrieri TaxID=77586 RepID=A0A0D9XZG7_9ORYZ
MTMPTVGQPPDDPLIEIILRLPPISGRRRVRLVCRRWRDAVDDNDLAPEISTARPKPLASLRQFACATTARVFDDLAGKGRGGTRKIHLSDGGGEIVGTCNGLICLWRGDNIVVVNPVTARAFLCRCRMGQPGPERLSFAYHPLTGEYKIVHLLAVVVAVYTKKGRDAAADMVVAKVLTLGDASSTWREITAPMSMSVLTSIGAFVDGVTYWVTKDKRIVSLDHEHDKRVTCVKPLPPAAIAIMMKRCHWRLTEVAGKLGIAITSYQNTTSNVEVWVLEGARSKLTWSHRYTVEGLQHGQNIAWPHFAYGENILTINNRGLYCLLYTHWLWPHKNRRSVARANMETDMVVEKFAEVNCPKMFSYVETTEPVNLYREMHR